MRWPWLVTVVMAVIAALVLPVTINIATGTLPESWKPHLWLAWPAAAVLATLSIVWELRRRSAASAVQGAEFEQLDRVVERLARAVREQWEAEVAMRSLRRPEPLHLRWSTTSAPVAAPPAAVLGPRAVGGRPRRLRLHGGLDDVVDKFLALPRRQLVVLGAPGAGKTVLAVLFTLDLLDKRRPDDPLPVLLTLSSWNPDEHLHGWIARRLIEDYKLRRSVATQLVSSGRVLPVLDGLDELPNTLRGAAIEGIDHALAGHKPVVVTCRSEEYQTAVTTSGQVLATAAVVELEPISLRDTIMFLSASTVASSDRWNPVFEHLRTQPMGPLAEALSTPLMVSLARTVYTNPATNPTDLLDSKIFTTRRNVEQHLLDAFLLATYREHRPPPPTSRPSHPARPHYRTEQVQRWLTFLACHLRWLRTRDLAWWQLQHATAGLVGGVRAGLVVGSISGLFSGIAVGPVAGITVGSVSALSASCVVGGLLSWLTKPPQSPTFPHVAQGALRPLVLAELWRWLVFGLSTSVVLSLGMWLYAGIVGPWEVILMTAIGLIAGLVQSLAMRGISAETTFAASPKSVLRGNKAASWLLALGTWIGFGFLLFVSFAVVAGVGDIPAWLLLFSGAMITACGLGWIIFEHWFSFLVARGWLALRGKLPWRLMTFLQDAHQRGVLRQVGAIYQFRHALLQDRLADLVDTSRPS
ncbi:MAG: NACHT domain-containing protein [Pseudonocardiaceae bacterium]